MKKVKFIIVTPKSSGKVEVLPRDDGTWAVREFEYDDEGKRTKTSEQVLDNEGVLELLKADSRFHEAFVGLAQVAA